MIKDGLVFFEIFPWNKNFETGIELIDEQHQKLVNILNKLAAHLANRSDEVILNDIFNELANYADYHFKTEEKIWDEYFQDDIWSLEHKDTHGSFMAQVITIKNNEARKPLDDVVYDIVSFLSKWLAYHILDTDKHLAIAVREMKAGARLDEAKELANAEMNGAMKVIVDTVLTMYDTLSTRTLDLMREKALRKQAEEALKISEERWKFILDGDEDNVWDWDIEQNIINQSNDDMSIFEITGNTLDGNKKENIIHSSDIERVKSDFQAHLNGKTELYTNKHRVLHSDGKWSWVLSRAKVVSRDENGKAIRMIGTNSDITKRELATLIHNNSSQAMCISDANDNRIISINPAFTKITGYSEDEVIGKKSTFLASGEDEEESYRNMWRVINSTGHWSGKISSKRKNGEIFIQFLDINVVIDSKGDIDHYISLFNDITEEEKYKKERKQQEEYLLQQSRMAQMGELINMVAHQWKQPLYTMALSSADLQMKLSLDNFDLTQDNGRKECKTYFSKNLEHVDGMIESLSATMDDFRNFYNPNKERSLELMRNPVTKALYIIKASLIYDKIEIDEDYKSDSVVSIYENEIIQVVLNILKNAQDHFKEKSTINPKITITTQSNEKGSTLKICDNGGGISDDILSKIFDSYFSTKNQQNGTGMGLYMSKTIIESHHEGTLYAENIYNEQAEKIGTCFIIELLR